MLSAADDELLTRTGPATGMGDLFRRFWMPVLLARHLPGPDCPPVRVRVLGEDLVAFRDTADRIALVEPRCPHRGADLFFGRNEACGLRCVYHGWKFDVTGACVELPTMARDAGLRSRVGIVAYPARAWGGLIWAYLGPVGADGTPPALPELEFALVPPAHRFVSRKLQECNWAQACEGALDTAHFSFLHTPLDVQTPASRHPMAHAMRWMRDDPQPVFHVREHDAGLLLAASRRADGDELYWRVTQFLMPNHSLAPGAAAGATMVGQTWVPIDDESCWVYVWSWNPDRPLREDENRLVPGVPSVHADVDADDVPKRNRGNDYLIDRDAQRTTSFTGIEGLSEQDAAIQDSQGRIADRTREHLGPTDLGIVRFRQLILGAAKALAAGVEPAAAGRPDAYRLRSGGALAPSATPVEQMLRDRFGNDTGAVEPATVDYGR